MTPEQAEGRWLEETTRSSGVGAAYTRLGVAISQARDAAAEHGPGHPVAMERLRVVETFVGDLRFEVQRWRGSQVEARTEWEGVEP